MAQTAMSRQIFNLENELGVQLFFRNNRKVELTSAGRELYLEALNLVECYNKAVIHVQNAAHGYTSSLKIGIGSYERNIARDIIRDFCLRYPYVEISCEQYDYKTLADKLEHGTLEVIFTIDKYTGSIGELESVIIEDSPWKLAVNDAHPWAGRESIRMQELKEQTIVTMNEGSREQQRHTLSIEARDYIYANSLDAKLLLVESGLGVAFVPSIIRDIISSHIILLDFNSRFIPRVFIAAYLKNSYNPALALFAELVKSHFEREYEQPGNSKAK